MIVKCCNPVCDTPFDYRQGRIIRRSRKVVNGEPAESRGLIEHFWLCGNCAERFVLEYESEISVRIKSHAPQISEEHHSPFVVAA